MFFVTVIGLVYFNRREARQLKPILRRTIPGILSALLLLLSGCTANAHTNAITNAVVAYSDYYIEVRNLDAQVRAQSKDASISATSAEYVISVDIPDYSRMDPVQAGFVLPEPDVSARSANAYEKQAALALRQALEQFALINGAEATIQLPVTFTLTADGGWVASMTSQSKLDIQETVEDMMLTLLQKDTQYLANHRLMEAASALSGLLTEALGGAEYADEIAVTEVLANPDGTFSASFTYPEAAFVYGALADAYVASFNQPFYGTEREVLLSTEGLRDIRLGSAPQASATVIVSYDEAAGTFALQDDGGLSELVSEARTAAQNAASEQVNASWRVVPLDAPANGSVLEGESRGNAIVFKTGISLGKYLYVRFYAISGEDTSEEGVLSLGVFIVGGKSAKVKLPTGYYRVSCLTGENWYGIEKLFGSEMKTFSGGNAIQSRAGYQNTITLN